MKTDETTRSFSIGCSRFWVNLLPFHCQTNRFIFQSSMGGIQLFLEWDIVVALLLAIGEETTAWRYNTPVFPGDAPQPIPLDEAPWDDRTVLRARYFLTCFANQDRGREHLETPGVVAIGRNRYALWPEVVIRLNLCMLFVPIVAFLAQSLNRRENL